MTARGYLHVFARPVAAIAAGVCYALAFPSVGWWWLAPIAVGLMTWTAYTSPSVRASVGWGALSGIVGYLMLVQWMSILGMDAWLALAAYSAVWIALTSGATRLLTRLAWWPGWVACLWVLQEAIRSRVPLGGFPWGKLAFSQANSPIRDLAAIGGSPLLTFVVALIGALLAWIVINRARVSWPRLGGAMAACLALVLCGLVVPTPTDGQTAGGPATATVALIQGSVPGSGLNAMGQRRAVLNNHVAVTMRLAADVAAGKVAKPQAVIWPENSSDIDPLTDETVSQAISRAADAVGAPILVGAVTVNPTDPTTVWNVGLVWNPGTGPAQYYVKRHPVPFGEYIPFRSVLSRLISRFDRVPMDFAGGATPGVLQLGPVRLGDVICFEIAYDQIVTDVVRQGARAISVQTNNATYLFSGIGGQAQPEQQAAMSQIRAVEHGRSVLIAATSGVTAVINPAGDVTAQLPLNKADYLVAQVPLRDSMTVAQYVAGWFELIIVLLATFGLVVAGVRVKRGHADQ